MNIGYLWNRFLKKNRGVAISNSKIDKTSVLEAGSTVVNTGMGRYSYCGYDCKIINCTIGSFCSISDNVSIGGAQHPYKWVSTSPVFYSGRDSISKKFSTFSREKVKKTVLANDVWIGEGVYIKAGITIATGAVIGMGSVVTKDVGPYEIWAGNPARLIRKRFDDETINCLLISKWWEMDDDKLKKVACHIREPGEFLKVLEGLLNI